MDRPPVSRAPRRGSKISRTIFRRVNISLTHSRRPCFTMMMGTDECYFRFPGCQLSRGNRDKRWRQIPIFGATGSLTCRYRTLSNGLAVAMVFVPSNEPSVRETTTKRTTLRHLWTMLGALGCVSINRVCVGLPQFVRANFRSINWRSAWASMQSIER
jgi:hypothetical protein